AGRGREPRAATQPWPGRRLCGDAVRPRLKNGWRRLPAPLPTTKEIFEMADKSLIGRQMSQGTVDVEKGRLRFFAKAIGESDPVYTDESAARDAGHPTLPVPPTFFM